MIVAHTHHEFSNFLGQTIKSVDMTARPMRPTVSRLIKGMHCEAATCEIHRHFVVATTMFPISVYQNHRPRRLLR